MNEFGGNPKSGHFSRKNLDQSKVEIKPFQPRKLTGDVANDYQQVKAKFGTLANTDPESDPHFNLHPAAKRLLGVEREERTHVEGIVRAEVDSRIEAIQQEAYQKGFDQGREEGLAAALAEHREIVLPMQEKMSALLEQYDSIKKDLYVANEAFLIQLVFQVGKQVILKELSTDRDYVKRLMVHVVEKVGAKDNIRIKVSRQDAENIEQLKDHLKAQIPDLKNIQIEASDDVPLGGCKVETDLSRVNASVETQLNSIEKALGEA